MTAVYNVRENQSLIDVAMQVYGTTDYLVKLCQNNALTLDSDLVSNQAIIYDAALSQQSTLPNYLKLNSLFIATGQVEILGETPTLLEHSIEYSAEEYS